METDNRVLQKIYVIWYGFCILCKSFPTPFKVKQLPSPWCCFFSDENHLFLISNDEKWWVWKVFARFITILNISVNIIQVLFVQVLSIFENLHSKFKSFLIEELKIP